MTDESGNTPIIFDRSPEFEAQQLLDDATRIVARELAEGIASLAYPVGMSIAPHPTECLAAARRLVEKFRGAIVQAVRGERAERDLANFKQANSIHNFVHQPAKEIIMADTAEAKTLKPVIVRTYSAGVHFGYLARRDGKEVELERSRRIWRWYGANSCSGLATEGLDIKRSSVAAPVSIVLTEAIEIIDCLPVAVASIEAASWTAQ